MDFHGYNAETLERARLAFKASPSLYHPYVRDWITYDFLQKRTSRKPAKTADAEYGLVRANLPETKRFAIYGKMLKMNGLHLTASPPQLWKRIESMVRDTLRAREGEPRVKKFERKVNAAQGDPKERVEHIINDVSHKMNVKPPRIGWLTEGPVRMAVYSARHRTLLLDNFVAENFRECDVIVLALHEIMGHVHQEAVTKGMPVPTSEAEWCAMKCEALSTKLLGTMRYAHEWRLFRLARALVDLRLHALPDHAKHCLSIWEAMNKKVDRALSHFVPFRDESLRVAALPGQALTYVLHSDGHTGSPRGCHSKCV